MSSGTGAWQASYQQGSHIVCRHPASGIARGAPSSQIIVEPQCAQLGSVSSLVDCCCSGVMAGLFGLLESLVTGMSWVAEGVGGRVGGWEGLGDGGLVVGRWRCSSLWAR